MIITNCSDFDKEEPWTYEIAVVKDEDGKESGHALPANCNSKAKSAGKDRREFVKQFTTQKASY